MSQTTYVTDRPCEDAKSKEQREKQSLVTESMFCNPFTAKDTILEPTSYPASKKYRRLHEIRTTRVDG